MKEPFQVGSSLGGTISINGSGELKRVVDAIDLGEILLEFRSELDEKLDVIEHQTTDAGTPKLEIGSRSVSRKDRSPTLVETRSLRNSLVDVGQTEKSPDTTSNHRIYGAGAENAESGGIQISHDSRRRITGIPSELIDKMALRIADLTADKIAIQQSTATAESMGRINT